MTAKELHDHVIQWPEGARPKGLRLHTAGWFVEDRETGRRAEGGCQADPQRPAPVVEGDGLPRRRSKVTEAEVSKLDKLIAAHEHHADPEQDGMIAEQHRDTAEALRLCRDVTEALVKSVHAMRAPLDDWKGHVEAAALEKANAALAALRDAGLVGDA